ncbi:ECF transporter S component [Natranaerobius thermophilus]|uniref:Riboflavin transporter n=1 Tax=Natranaerobius thermophilus (strain ATCC BAA-1301 / DSM 18059 / JW/NM-WN-LF) TaxID=457570 RepID=B2A6S1_NATTJ|nr:ECF transporter S component [Natranaerobius thermophilus]ACB84202.1 conserved hypothetical protein [Natranaerobius thermophilus JW/NM-WN-LF]
MNQGQRINVRQLVYMGLLVGIGTLLMVTVQIPVFTEYLMYDPSDVAMLIGGFWFGPLAGIVMSFFKALLYLFSKGLAGPIGAMANFFATAAFVGVAAFIYQRDRTFRGAVKGMIMGTLAMVILSGFTNYFIALPLWGIPQEALLPTILAATTPFNIFRGTVNSILTIFVYKRVKKLLQSL